jgi:hypothetical protein
MTDKHTRTFEITVTSPFGKQPIEQFEHYISKVKDESKERWNIDITISEVENNE